jgi:hypothetical protein
MRRAVGITILLGLVAASSAAAAQPRFTHCAATTLTQQGEGQSVFVGSCGGRATSLKVGPGSVTGRLGGLTTTLEGGGASYAGLIGKAHASFEMAGGVVTGRYGGERLHFELLGFSATGTVGPDRVTCSLTTLAPLGERVLCKGARGDAQVLIPLLAKLYTSP